MKGTVKEREEPRMTEWQGYCLVRTDRRAHAHLNILFILGKLL